MSITLGDSSLNVALIPASTSTLPSDGDSTTVFVLAIQWHMVASRSSTLRAMFMEAGVVDEEDIKC